MRDFLTRDAKQVLPNTLVNDAPKENRFYAFWTRGSKTDYGNNDDGKLLYLFL